MKVPIVEVKNRKIVFFAKSNAPEAWPIGCKSFGVLATVTL